MFMKMIYPLKTITINKPHYLLNEFEQELERRTTVEELFSDELKHIQKMALIGVTGSCFKQTLIE